MKRDLLRLTDFSRDEVYELIDSATQLKQDRIDGISHERLKGKTLGMVFNKSSTRTRISFEVGMFQLGGHAVVLAGDNLHLTRGETVADTAKIFSRYLDALVIRTYEQSEVEELALVADIPVINALTDKYHPCQILADLLTIKEKKGTLEGIKIAYVGDGNNVAHSLLLGGAVMGMNVSVATPSGYEPLNDVVEQAKLMVEKSGATIDIGHDPKIAVDDADVIYTDTWISMGQDDEAVTRRKAFEKYQVNSSLVAEARPDAIVMHCLPAHRGEEISAEVMDGPQSVVWDEAENRLHMQKAILLKLLG